MSDFYLIIAEHGFGSMDGSTAATFDTLEAATEFVADPPSYWRGDRCWPWGLTVFQAYEVYLDPPEDPTC